MIRLAAVGDIHLGTESRGKLRPHLATLSDQADALLLAGDLTHIGSQEEIDVVAGELEGLDVPVVAVLGNHDHHSDRPEAMVTTLEAAGVTVLEGTATTIETASGPVGVAGAKGFGGGFPPAMASNFGEPEMRAFARTGEEAAASLREALLKLDTGLRIALTHYSPSRDTLVGERPEIHPFLGSIALAQAVDEGDADLAIHGHAHLGRRFGHTPGGVPVHNVALPLLDGPFLVLELNHLQE